MRVPVSGEPGNSACGDPAAWPWRWLESVLLRLQTAASEGIGGTTSTSGTRASLMKWISSRLALLYRIRACQLAVVHAMPLPTARMKDAQLHTGG